MAELRWGTYPQTITAYICPVCGWTLLEENGIPGQECEAHLSGDSDAEPHGRCDVVGLVPAAALERALELLSADRFYGREVTPLLATLVAARASEEAADA